MSLLTNRQKKKKAVQSKQEIWGWGMGQVEYLPSKHKASSSNSSTTTTKKKKKKSKK
jgi:hypothetical protein